MQKGYYENLKKDYVYALKNLQMINCQVVMAYTHITFTIFGGVRYQ